MSIGRYENETIEAILERMKAELESDIDKREGSVTHDMLYPASKELEKVYEELSNMLVYGFAGPETPREYLIRRAAELGVTPLPSVKARGYVTFTGVNGTFIDVGTVVYTDDEDAIYFETIESGAVNGGQVTLEAQALDGGISGNVGAGEITLVDGDLTGVVNVTNAEPFEGGTDVESTESLLSRYLDRARKPATSGNANQYEQWAKSIAGVGDARVYPLWNGNGTVKVVLLSTEKRSPAQFIIDEVQAFIDPNMNGDGSGVAPIGATVTVEGAQEVEINVSATVILASQATISEVIADYTEALQEYLESIAFDDPIVRYTQIASLLLGVPNIIDYSDLTVNGGTSNIEVADGEVAVVGEVTFDEQS